MISKLAHKSQICLTELSAWRWQATSRRPWPTGFLERNKNAYLCGKMHGIFCPQKRYALLNVKAGLAQMSETGFQKLRYRPRTLSRTCRFESNRGLPAASGYAKEFCAPGNSSVARVYGFGLNKITCAIYIYIQSP